VLTTEGYILMHTLNEHNKDINKPSQEDNACQIRHHCLRLSILFFAQLDKIIIVVATYYYLLYIL